MTAVAYHPAVPLFIGSFSGRYSGARDAMPSQGGASFGSAAWPAANRAIYVPINLPFTYPVNRVWWVNGATVTNNVDLGIYDGRTLARIYATGATAQSGASAPQYVATDLLLVPGSYYLGLSLNGTSTVFRSNQNSAIGMRESGCVQETSAHPLPASITPEAVASAYWPLFGITRTESGY